MVATSKRKQTPLKTPSPHTSDTSRKADNTTAKLPPFAKHFKSSTAANATPFKVGDSKEWNGQTWYFCDCPNHRDRVKWHTHTAATCRSRLRWLEGQSTSTATPPAAHVAADNSDITTLTDPTGLASSSHSDPSDVTSLLAAALPRW